MGSGTLLPSIFATVTVEFYFEIETVTLLADTRAILSHDRSVGIAPGYGLDDRGSRVRLQAGAGNFSLHHRFQNGSGAHSASYSLGTSVSFPRGKAAGA
jgi:hypothetical protein